MDPPHLEGRHVSLRLMSKADAGALVAAASDGELWNLAFTVVPNQVPVDAYVDTACRAGKRKR